MNEVLSTDPWEGVLGSAERETGLQPGILAAIAAQENVNPEHNNPLGLSTDAGVMSFGQDAATQRIRRQAKLMMNPRGPYGEFARTGSIDALAKVWSPVGARNDINGTNITEAAGIMAHMIGGQRPGRVLSTDPNAGLQSGGKILSTNPSAGLVDTAKAPGRAEPSMTPALAGANEQPMTKGELGDKPSSPSLIEKAKQLVRTPSPPWLQAPEQA